MTSALDTYWAALEARHLQTLTFQEVRRALTALSSLYVERRDKLASGSVFEGAGKRAAFALFYGPMHFAVIEQLAHALALPRRDHLVDLGCGTGVGGAAWAVTTGSSAVTGWDVARWALEEARFTYAHFGLRGEARLGDTRRAELPAGSGIVCAYTVNELASAERDALLGRLVAAHAKGSPVLVVEPIAKRDRPWWPEWEQRFAAAGGRADEWRFAAAMPERWRLLDRAAGLRHQELTARTLYLPP